MRGVGLSVLVLLCDVRESVAVSGDPIDFLSWLMNTLHKALGGTKKADSRESWAVYQYVYYSILQYTTVYYSMTTVYYSVLQCITVYYSMATVYYSILQYTTVVLQYRLTAVSHGLCTSMYITVYYSILQYITVYYSILQYITVYYSILQYITVYCSILQCTTVYYSILQYTTVYYSVLGGS